MTSDSGAVAGSVVAGSVVGLRPLLIGQAISSVGDGLWITLGIIYLTSLAHFAVTTVGFTVALSNIVGITLTYPAGVLADRIGGRRVLVGLTTIRGVAAAMVCVIHTVPLLLATCIAFLGTQGASNGVRTALVCAVAPAESRMTTLARIRVAQHVAYAAGAGLGAAVLTVGRYEAFMTAFVANAVTFAVMAVFTLRVPECPIGIRAAAGRAIPTSTALRDYPYQLVMFVTALFALCWAMLTTGFPLWIRDSTKAPAWMAAAVVFLSSLAISAFQLRVTRYVTTARANRAARIAGFALAASCAVLASASRTTAMCAALLVAVAIILHILGELFFVAVRWRLSIELMDPQYSGSYQGIAYTGESAMLAAGPAVLALVVTAPGTLGWILLTGLFAVAGLATPALHRYAVSHRPVGAGAGTEQATQQ